MTEEEIKYEQDKPVKVKPSIKQKTILEPDKERIPNPVKQEKRDEVKKKMKMVGFDRNYNNLTGFDTDGDTTVYDTSEILEQKNQSRETISHFKRQDFKVMRRLYRKYGVKTTNRIMAIIHAITNDIIENNDGIVLEDLNKLNELWNNDKHRGKDAKL